MKDIILELIAILLLITIVILPIFIIAKDIFKMTYGDYYYDIFNKANNLYKAYVLQKNYSYKKFKDEFGVIYGDFVGAEKETAKLDESVKRKRLIAISELIELLDTRKDLVEKYFIGKVILPLKTYKRMKKEWEEYFFKELKQKENIEIEREKLRANIDKLEGYLMFSLSLEQKQKLLIKISKYIDSLNGDKMGMSIALMLLSLNKLDYLTLENIDNSKLYIAIAEHCNTVLCSSESINKHLRKYNGKDLYTENDISVLMNAFKLN